MSAGISVSDYRGMSATALVRAWRRGELCARDIAAAALAAADDAAAVNAFAHLAPEAAQAAAGEVDRRAGQPGALAAVPVTVKDIINTRDMPTQWGSLLMQGQTPPADAAAVARLRQSQALILGKSTTSEFAYKLLTDTRLHGVTRNPWSLAHTPGGSSGGAAASVAAGAVPLALATDAGASTRLPAACCGVLGLKPTLGRIPHNQVPDAFGNFIHLGLMAREAADLALFLQALQGPHPADPYSLGHCHGDPLAALTEPLQVAGLRIGWLPLAGNQALDAGVQAACLGVLQALEDAGAHVEEIADPVPNPGQPWRVLQQANWAGRWGARLDEVRDRIEPGYARGIAEGAAYTGAQLTQAAQKRTELFRMVQGWFARHDLIATPAMSAPPLRADHAVDQPLAIAGRELGDLREEWIPYLNLFNLSSHPALSVPAGRSERGLPLGIQFVAPWHGDSLLVRMADWIERHRPWPRVAPYPFPA